ncbi:MAG: phospholipid carrier-dependent glycosyltransferase [Chloroflexi bacterium]|nr:phospholipid carrier-dependent glycosyltransferase [Chloroflexota bacterium]
MNSNLIKRIPFGLILIVLLGTLLRFYAIDRLPPGLFGDEAVEGLDALDILAGNWQIWFHAHLGREPLFVYLVATSYFFFGVSPFATRLPAILAGIVTIPAAYWLTREWCAQLFSAERARRIAILTALLLAISFWHLELSRNAHRDILLPLVQAVGYAVLWRAIRLREVRLYALAGAILGLAIYTYSPGRFVGVFIAAFCALELFLARYARRVRELSTVSFNGRGFWLAGGAALLVMLPLGIYFAQNPAQFSRRFESVSILRAEQPLSVLSESIAGNLAMFVVPGAGYASTHYNLPGKPVFDLFLAPWFIAGIVLAFARARRAEYRFLLLWFFIMLMPAFLTSDMIPKGVRDFGVVPGVFVFPALAADWVLGKFGTRKDAKDAKGTIETKGVNRGLTLPHLVIAFSLVASALLTVNDYFFEWAKLPTLPTAFDQDYAQVAAFVRREPANEPIYVSAEVYRHPTFMLLGQQIPTSRYFDRATHVREFDARSALVAGADDANAAYVFLGDYAPSAGWLARIAVPAAPLEQHENFSVFRLARLQSPQQMLKESFNPFLKLVGVARFADDPRGLALYWQVTTLPDDRAETQARSVLFDARSQPLTQFEHRIGVPPMDWHIGDVIVDWFEIELPANAARFSAQLERGAEKWESAPIAFDDLRGK